MPLVVDTDPGVDDVFALVGLLAGHVRGTRGGGRAPGPPARATPVDRREQRLPGTELPKRRPVRVAVAADTARIPAELLEDIAELGRYV
ncbi:nucleoside hydrolase [Kutzneria buriramensis]|uniref:nucleoside hydrolase n=1 Tax=Kutzneria buriramensis TaxID=1045776 RepID=UPI0011C1BC80|nr:nucleoside hydrolase [Kutzneria buriramensis]